MTKKRFTLHLESNTLGYITDNFERKTYYFGGNVAKKRIVEILNKLHNENTQLKQRINELKK